MVDRVNGAPRQGVWFSADVAFVQVTASGGAFLADLTVTTTDPRQADVVNSGLEQVLEVLATRGTVIALSVASATVIHVILDYAQAFVSEGTTIGNQAGVDVSGDLEAQIDAISGLSSSAIVIEQGFATAALGTPV